MADSVKNKILIFSLAYHPFVGGAEVAVKEITDRLPEYNWEMLTVNLDGRQKTEEQIGNIFVHRLGRGKMAKYLFPWLAYRKALELQKENDYQTIWAMMANQAGLAALFFKLKFPRVKYLLTLQEGDSELDIWLRTWLIRPLYKAIYRRADQIQTISNFLAERAKKLGVKSPIEVVPNGVSIKNYELRIKNNNVKKIISVSRLVKKNGLEYLVKAMQVVNANLILLGNGKLKNSLIGLRDGLKLNNEVIFKGEVTNEQVYEHLSQADVFVRPSLSEGLGNAFLEAMAMGVPIIGTKVGGIPDFLVDGETGWFCEVKNPKSIAEKINYVLDEKNLAEVKRVVDNAYKLVKEKYNWNKISEDMKNIFNKLI